MFFFIKVSQLDAFNPYAIVYCYLEFKLSYLKNLKLFSIRPKKENCYIGVMGRTKIG